MTDQLHVLLLGFDVQRIVKPLSSGIFSPDRVLLIRGEHDPKSESVDNSHDQLLVDVHKAVSRDLEHYLDVDVEERRLPLFADFPEVFQAFYDFLDETAPEHKLTVNLSAAPKSTALAVTAARATWLSEHPDQDEAINLYYFKPQRYLETDIRAQLAQMVDRVDDITRARRTFEEEAEADLAAAMTDPVEDALERVKECRNAVDEYIEDTADAAVSGEAEDEEGGFLDSIGDIHERIPDLLKDVEPSEELTELEAFLSKASDLSSEIEENPGRTVDAFRKGYRIKIREHEVPDRKAEPLMEAIDELDVRVQTMVETREALQADFESLHREITRAQQAANQAEDLLDRISRGGMTEGTRGEPEDWYIPMPPTADLREVEKVILYVLRTRGKQRSVQALARSTAEELRTLGEEIGANPGDSDMATEALNCCVRMDEDEQVGDDFEEFVADRLRNRLQYNLQSLETAGYIDREKAERRVETTLSATGELWADIRNLSEIRRTALEEELHEQLEAFVA